MPTSMPPTLRAAPSNFRDQVSLCFSQFGCQDRVSGRSDVGEFVGDELVLGALLVHPCRGRIDRRRLRHLTVLRRRCLGLPLTPVPVALIMATLRIGVPARGRGRCGRGHADQCALNSCVVTGTPVSPAPRRRLLGGCVGRRFSNNPELSQKLLDDWCRSSTRD